MRQRSLFTAIIILVLAYLSQMGCSSDTEPATTSAKNHTEQGWNSYRSGDYTLALLSFERALNIDPEFADAHNGVGWSQLSLSINLTLSQEAFQNAVRFDSSNADAWVGLANVLYLRYKGSSDFEAAIRAIDNALQSDTGYLFRHDYDSNAELYALKAACYFYLGDIQTAREEVNKALQINAENRTVIVLNNLLKQ